MSSVSKNCGLLNRFFFWGPVYRSNKPTGLLRMGAAARRRCESRQDSGATPETSGDWLDGPARAGGGLEAVGQAAGDHEGDLFVAAEE